MKIEEIESAIYGEKGLYARVIKKIEETDKKEVVEKTGKKIQQIDIFKRQFYFPEKFDYRPKLETIKEFAQKLGVE